MRRSFRRRGLALAVALAAIAVTWALAAGGASGGGAGGQGGRQAPEPAPPPGAKLEVAATQAKLMASPPGLLSDVPARLHNVVGTAQHGARLVLVMATDDFYNVAIDCQDGKVHVEAWVDRKDVRPASGATGSGGANP